MGGLLLGTASIVFTLVAWSPLGVGGVDGTAYAAGTLTLLALDQLGPAFAEVTADLPRWLPPAVGGALLLAVGSTYERRLAELRRARDAFANLG